MAGICMTDLREAMRQTAASSDLVAVDVPEWERKVYIRKLTVRDQAQIDQNGDPTTSAVKVLVAALVDENGEQLLTMDDFELLLDQPVSIIVPLLLEAGRQNGLTSKELEEAVSSLGTTPGQPSSTE